MDGGGVTAALAAQRMQGHACAHTYMYVHVCTCIRATSAGSTTAALW